MYLIAYVPVLHEGYRTLFAKYPDAELFLVGPGLVPHEFPRLGRDLRQLPVEVMRDAVAGMRIVARVSVLDEVSLRNIDKEGGQVVMPVDEVSTMLAERLPHCTIRFENVFLRWDKPITLAEQEVSADRVMSSDALDRELMDRAAAEAQKSADWWRQIGAVAVRDGKTLYAGYNAHHPSEHAVFAFGNPRDNFDAGEQMDIYPTIHAEAGIVARAARHELAGASIYVTTFPCINCARLLAEAGVAKVYYRDGYSRLDAEQVLKDHGIEIIRVSPDTQAP